MGFLPAYRDGDYTVIWLRGDLNWDTWVEVQAEFGFKLQPVVISDVDFNLALQRAFERSGTAVDAIEDLGEAVDLETVSAGLPEDLLDSQDDAPIIRLLNAVLTQAIEEGASDVHVEPLESRLVIRYRVDGILRDVVEPPSALSARLVARIKVMARLNIAERRVPQDGRISLRLAGRLIDIRVSTLPTYYGERVVMRILEKVYAALQQVRSPGVNIITIEDPVEYDLEGVGQTPVNNKTGMSFARGLRAILRQDPDVIMVGEIRDLETAQVSVQASLTGHLVFSTLHTNDAVGSITRLMDMGVEPYLVASSLLGVMAQRLVRKLCKDCQEPHEADEGERQLLGIETTDAVTIYHPTGCENCSFTGYRGRTGIYELMIINDVMKHLIHDQEGEQPLKQAARKNGMHNLREDGLSKVIAGITSLEEVIRVAQS
jgi:general secretion pathway protein E